MRTGGRRGLRIEQRDDVRSLNSFPTTAPRSSTARSPGPRRSRRAASSAWIVSGSVRSASPPSSASARSCSRKSGLPSAASTMRARWSDSSVAPPRPSSSASASSAESASRTIRSTFVAPVEERRSLLEQLLAGEADDRDRPLSLVREVLDELEERRLRPVDVVEDEDERPLARARLAELSEEPGELGRRRRRLGVERGEDRVALVARPREIQHLAQRPVRDAVAVREAAAPERRDTLRAPRQLGGEPRLADSRRADDDGDAHGGAVDGALQRPPQRGELRACGRRAARPDAARTSARSG